MSTIRGGDLDGGDRATDGERLEKGMRKIEAKLHHSRLCHAEAATAVGGA